ncbi:MAG: aminopeptidase P N-terminal domain-containing protein [Bacteroidia bacterium]|nr:aminopeptidase P N-terminal domain-containing protein [Bacteroidia bacterium]
MRFLFFLFLLPGIALAQEIPIKIKSELYDSDGLTPEFHKGRRDALRALMPEGSVAIFFANPVRNRNNDVDYEYAQNPDFYYLTGLMEPNAVVLIFKDEVTIDGVKTKEIIFVQDRNPKRETWEGKRLGKEGVRTKLGFAEVRLNSEFESTKIDFKSFKTILPPFNFRDIRNEEGDGDLYDLWKTFESTTEKLGELKNFKLQEELMSQLRMYKQPEELTLLRKAISITCEAENQLMRAAKPNMTEYQSEAIVEFFFKHRGAEFEGYPSILGSGENSCVLHYNTNRKRFENGDLLLSDVGAEYHGYTADVTRTFPVNGKFSPEQRIIYNLVLEAQTQGINACLSGNGFWDPHKAAAQVIGKGLKKLGIIKDESEYRKYFIHGTSHYLGLDVHDLGLYGPLEPGQVITVEPGIYIPEGSDCDPKWWNIGIRIEDDILITNSQPENLSAGSPRTIEEIEAIMQLQSPFKDLE